MSRFERWSRVKRGLNDGSENAPEAPLDELNAPPPTAASVLHETDQESDEIIADDIIEPDDELTSEQGELDVQLPDPATLDPNDDFKAYLAPGVSPELKRRALRHMFTASSYNVRDGLDDYDQDFTQIRDLSRDVASTLRRWIKELPKDTENVDDSDAQSLATEVNEEEYDNTTSDLAQAFAPPDHRHDEDDDTPTRANAGAYDPSRPTDGTA